MLDNSINVTGIQSRVTNGDDYSTNVGVINNYISDVSPIFLNNQLEEFKKHLFNFSPKTALHFIERAEEHYPNITPLDNAIKSKILYLKALCKQEIHTYSVEDYSKLFIEAHNLNNDDKSIKEKACLAYYKLGKFEKSKQLANNLISIDEFNIIGKLILTFLSDNIKNAIRELPNHFLNNYSFKLSLVYFLKVKHNVYLKEDLRNFGVSFEIDETKYTSLTFENKALWESTISILITWIQNKDQNLKVKDFSSTTSQSDFNILCSLLNTFNEKLKDTELRESISFFEFYQYYFLYIKSPSAYSLNTLKEKYFEIDTKDHFLTTSLVQLMMSSNENDAALEILENLKGSSQAYYMSIFIYLRLNNNEKTEEVFTEFINSSEEINDNQALNILKLVLNNGLLIKSPNLITEKIFENNITKEIVLIAIKVSSNIENRDELETQINKILSNSKAEELDFNFKYFISILYFRIGKLKLSFEYIKTFIDRDNLNHLRLYISILNSYIKSDEESPIGLSKELLGLLKQWRESISVDSDFLQLEYNMAIKLEDWEYVKMLIETGFENKFCEHEKEFWVHSYVNVLEKLNLLKELESYSDTIETNFKNERYGRFIVQVLERNNINVDKAFMILYNLACNSENIDARMQYCYAFKPTSNYIKKYDIVELNHYVKFIVEATIQVELISDTYKFKEDFLNKKIGESFQVNGKLVEILDIFNKEFKLFQDIYDEIKSNPLNQYGATHFTFPENDENIIDFFKDKFGKEGEIRERFVKTELLNYKNFQIGFINITLSNFKQNPIDAYFYLTKSSDGQFNSIPSTLTQPISEDTDNKYIIDFTSLLLFYDISTNYNVEFKHKFITSNSLKEVILNEIQKIKTEPQSFMNLSVTSTEFQISKVDENFHNDRLNHYQNILKWLDENCELDIVEEKLDLLAKIDTHDGKHNILGNLSLELMILTNRDNYKLITSDSFYYNFFNESGVKNKILNPEKFIQNFYPQLNYENICQYLINNNYVGIELNINVVKSEFDNHISNKENRYFICLENFKINNPSQNNFIIAIDLIKYIYLKETLSLDAKNLNVSAVLNNLLWRMDFEYIQFVSNVVNKAFELLPQYRKEINQLLSKYFNTSIL